ncbi:SRPBCC family protein [Halalkalicoccus salilacus]|uniref:hypothetical protein n=1 Tax=Halalkalicoccus salilacus TaxID=3117459 RepID=UPI00300F1092
MFEPVEEGRTRFIRRETFDGPFDLLTPREERIRRGYETLKGRAETHGRRDIWSSCMPERRSYAGGRR